MSKGITAIIMVIVVAMLLAPGIASAITVEVDNYMPADMNFCYNSQIVMNILVDDMITKPDTNPAYSVAIYRLEMLVPSFSTNGRISGLEAGIKARSPGLDCSTITFVDGVNDWRPVLEKEVR